MGNIESDGKVATLDYVDKFIELTGEHSIIGRACVVHSGTDDLGEGSFPDSKTTGHAGGRLGCGVIGRSSPF
jgi:Cu-Zn family superoxide dismutase